jgi:hypothetical protein
MTPENPIIYRGGDGRTHTIDQSLVQRRPTRIEGDQRPIVALDVDGVINALDPAPGAGWNTFEVTIPANYLPDSDFIKGYGARDLPVRLHLHAKHRAWITGLQQRAEVIWATTWEDAANAVIAALHQLPRPLPVLEVHRYTHVSEGAMFAKEEALREYAAGRPVVFVDDNAPKWWVNGDGLDGRSLAVAPDPNTGLSEGNQSQISAFLDWAQNATADDRYSISQAPSPGRWAIDTDAGDHIEVLCELSAQTDYQLRWHTLNGAQHIFSNYVVHRARIGETLNIIGYPDTRSADADDQDSGLWHPRSPVTVGRGRVTRITAQLQGR